MVVKDVLLREDKVREVRPPAALAFYALALTCYAAHTLPLLQLFKSLHRLYVEAACNPFAHIDGKITSPRFEERVYNIVVAANSSIEYKGPVPA